MYILQMSTSANCSVVLGCYDTMTNMKTAAQKHKDHCVSSDNDYFYDYKEVNLDAVQTNEQEAVWL